MMPERRIHAYGRESARYPYHTTVDDEKHHNRVSVVVMALCNEAEALASDLGDYQSRYLLMDG